MVAPAAIPVTGTQRAAAAVALLSAALTVLLAVTVAISRFPSGLGVLACVLVAVTAAWFAVVRRGTPRVVGIVLAALALVGTAALLFRNNGWLTLALLVLGVVIWHAAARTAFRVHLRLPAADPPRNAVLFVNPWSGGGKAAKVGLAAEAADRGIRTVELTRGADLEELVRLAVAEGADGLAAAGGDGTQAIVATAAAEHGLPYACIPAGTRNHFALDLGVDRDDVVGALDAFVDGGEHVVDLGEVNGRVFVNNVSMGLYAEAVQRTGYRDAKIRTLLDTAPAVLGPSGSELDLRWVSPDGTVHASAATILVSNNPYRLGHAVGSGTRPRIDAGRLGIAVVPARSGDGTGHGAGQRGPRATLRQWSTAEFEVDSARPVPLGIDGEAVVLDPPVRFRIRPRTLRVRISPRHPGASPSAVEPAHAGAGVRALAAIAAGRLPSDGPVSG
ncbi:MAG TPA: diacylglycerol kinase family protein [Pseudonocardia sp.]|jgi:diacylglycerol kinase family enzyme